MSITFFPESRQVEAESLCRALLEMNNGMAATDGTRKKHGKAGQLSFACSIRVSSVATCPGMDDPLDHIDEMAQSQKSGDVKRISHEYPLRAISGNWPTVAKLSGKTPLFGVLALVVAQWVRRSLHRCNHCMQRLKRCNDQVPLERVLCLFANFATRLAKYFSSLTS